MSPDLEHRVTQNEALGAVAIWQFTRAYYDRSGQMAAPRLPLILCVLPIVLHRRTIEHIGRMQAASGLPKALHDMPDLSAGLQGRLEGLYTRSLESLSIAVATELLITDPAPPWPSYIPVLRTLPRPTEAVPDMALILGAAKRLGWWFSGLNDGTIYRSLSLQF